MGDVTPAVAVSALRKLVAFELLSAGFDSADQTALEEFEGIVYSCAYLIHELDWKELIQFR